MCFYVIDFISAGLVLDVKKVFVEMLELRLKNTQGCPFVVMAMVQLSTGNCAESRIETISVTTE